MLGNVNKYRFEFVQRCGGLLALVNSQTATKLLPPSLFPSVR